MVYFRSRGGSTGQTNGGARWNHFRLRFCRYAASSPSFPSFSAHSLHTRTVSYTFPSSIALVRIAFSLPLLVYKQIKIRRYHLEITGQITVYINSPSWKLYPLDRSQSAHRYLYYQHRLDPLCLRCPSPRGRSPALRTFDSMDLEKTSVQQFAKRSRNAIELPLSVSGQLV